MSKHSSLLLLACLAVAGVIVPSPAQNPTRKLRVESFRYAVKTGDTPSSLAKKWGLPVRLVARKGRALRAGDVITIRLRDRHRIRSGDSLAALSRHYRVPLETLAKFNSLHRPYRLIRGKILLIPDLGKRRAVRRKRRKRSSRDLAVHECLGSEPAAPASLIQWASTGEPSRFDWSIRINGVTSASRNTANPEWFIPRVS